MAKQFLGTRYQSLKNDGTVNALGWVYFYEIGTSTEKTTYSDSDLGTPNASPVVLNAAGAADIWYTGDADVSVYDSTGTLVDSYPNINPAETSTANEANLIINGSFETGTSTTAPDGWVRSDPYSGGTSVQDTDSRHGLYSWKFTSVGNGGGVLTSESFFNVAIERPFALTWLMKSSVADVRNVVEVLWYDDADAYISASTAYDNSTTNSTSWSVQSYTATPVATAVKAKLRITGCASSDATAGSAWFDGVNVNESVPLGADYKNASYTFNVGLTTSVAAKALTVALKTKALADSSSGSPVQIAFRNATATTGDYVVRSATAATSVVVPSGATLGFTAAEAGSVYVYAIDNAGTVELAVSKKSIFDESKTHDTTAIGTGSDSNNVLYSTSARTGVAVRLIGRIDITTGAVAGEWDNEDTRITVWTPDNANIPLRIASASGSVAGSLLISSASFSPAVNVEVGDVIIFNVRLNGTTGAAAGTHKLDISKGGTALLEFTAAGLGSILFSSGAITPSVAINNCYTLKYHVTAAGTFTGVGCASVSAYGTSMTSLSTEHQTEVWRGWNV